MINWLSHYHQEMVGFSYIYNKVLFIPQWGKKKKQPLFVLNSLILQLLCQNCHRIMLYSSPLILEGCFERPNQKEIGVLSLVVLCR